MNRKSDCQYFYIILKNNYFFFSIYFCQHFEPWCWVWLPATAWSLCINIKLDRTLARQYGSHAAMQSMRFKINKKSMAADKCMSWLLMGLRKWGGETKRRERKAWFLLLESSRGFWWHNFFMDMTVSFFAYFWQSALWLLFWRSLEWLTFVVSLQNVCWNCQSH